MPTAPPDGVRRRRRVEVLHQGLLSVPAANAKAIPSADVSESGRKRRRAAQPDLVVLHPPRPLAFRSERLSESEIEAFDVEMADWVAFVNTMFGQREHTSAEEALAKARKRANELESRLRR